MLLTTKRPAIRAIEAGTGWTIKPEGACRGEVCVPLPSGTVLDGRTIDAARFAERLGMPLVTDEASGLMALGPSSMSGRALVTAEAPDFELPDLNGTPFRLSSLRGRKVVIVSWAPY